MESKKEQQKQTAILEESSPKDFLRAARAQLKDKQPKAAYVLLQQGILHYPDDPIIVSYYGCLQAVVDKRYRSGVDTCKKAFSLIKKEMTGKQSIAAVLCLNLGRAYIAAGRRQEAVEAIEKGLKYDRRNPELIKELQIMGKRKKPPLPFLSRSNPLNKYIGMLLHKQSKQPASAK